MNLTEFLTARIADDEAEQSEANYGQNQWHRGWCRVLTYDAGPCDCGLAAFVLAECEAKRRIVELFGANIAGDVHPADFAHYKDSEDALKLLALPYADDPDYNEEWRI